MLFSLQARPSWARSAVLLALALLVLSLSHPPAVEAGLWFQSSTRVTRTLRDFGYPDQTSQSMYRSFDYLLPVPRGQTPRDGTQLELVISHSPLVLPERSTMTVVLNGRPVHSVPLSVENRDRGRVLVPLPPEDVGRTGFQVQVQFSLRLTRDECEEAQNPALWATVHAESQYHLITQSAVGPGLEEVDGLLTPVGAPPPPVRFVVPADAHPQELEAAGIAAFQIGRWGAAPRLDPELELDSVVSARGPTIVVGGPRMAPILGQLMPSGLESDGERFLAGGSLVPSDQGVLAVSRTPAAWLLVSGTSPMAVREAAETLARADRRAALRGDYALIGRSAGAPPPVGVWSEGAASFAQLGQSARSFVGPGDHVVDLVFERPPAWVLKDRTALELVLATSPSIRPDTSWIAVIVNGREAGARKVHPSSEGSRTYRFELTPELLNADLDGSPLRHLALQLRLHLEIPQSGCMQTLNSTAWATLLPTSAWYLPHDPIRSTDLARFPGQLLGRNVDAPVLVALPESPSGEELLAGLQTIAAMGRWSAEDVARLPRLVYSNTVTDQERQQSHVVLIGGPDRNALSAVAAQRDSSWFTPYTPPAYRSPGGELRGTLRLLPSPWSRDRLMLILTGNQPEALGLASAGLSQRPLLLGLRGNVASIVEALAPQNVELTAGGAAPRRLDPRVETPPVEPPTAPRVVAGILLVALGACAAFVIRARTRQPSSSIP